MGIGGASRRPSPWLNRRGIGVSSAAVPPVTEYTLTGKFYLADDTWTTFADFRSPNGTAGDVYAEGYAGGSGGTQAVGGGGGGASAGGRVTPGASEAINVPPVSAADTNAEDASFGALIVAKAGLRGTDGGTGGLASGSTGTWARNGGNGTLGTGARLGGASAGIATAGAGTVPGEPNGGRSSSTIGGGRGSGGGSSDAGASQGRRGAVLARWQVPAVAGACRLVGMSQSRIPADGTSIPCTMPHDGEGNAIDFTGLCLVAVIGTDGNPAITEGSGDWTALGTVANGTACSADVFYIENAVGDETLTVALSASNQGNVHIYAYADAGGPPSWATPATGSSGSPNPPSHSPPGGSGKYQWITGFVADAVGNPDVTAFPANYENQVLTPNGNTTGVLLCTGTRYADGANQDPGAYAIDNGVGGATSPAWIAFTISIPPLVLEGGAGPSTVQVAAWGDSTTAQADSYRNRLWQRAQASASLRVEYATIATSGTAVDPPCDDADNGGFSGERIEQVTTRVAAYSGAQPDYVIAMLGINNINQGQSAATALTHMDAHIDALKAKHTTAQAAGKIYIVACQYGLGGNAALTASGALGTFNAGLPALCASKSVNFIDIHAGATPWVPATHAEDDTGHQNTAGGIAVGNTIATALGI